MRTLILSITAFLSFSATAATSCEPLIAHLNELQTQFSGWHYENKTEQDLGFEKEDNAIEPIHDFDSLPKNDSCRLRAWKAFVDLAQAQSPFDGESRAAEVISKHLMKDKSLESSYQQSLKDFPDHCRSQKLSSIVQLDLCISQRHLSYDKCEREDKFDYLKCIKSK